MDDRKDLESADRQRVDDIVAVLKLLAARPVRERLDVLESAWSTMAAKVRLDAQRGVEPGDVTPPDTPGGFHEERSRQIEHLQNMLEAVAADSGSDPLMDLSQAALASYFHPVPEE